MIEKVVILTYTIIAKVFEIYKLARITFDYSRDGNSSLLAELNKLRLR